MDTGDKKYAVIRHTYIIAENKDYVGASGESIGYWRNFVWEHETFEDALAWAISLLNEPRFANKHLVASAIDQLTYKHFFEHGGEMIMIGLVIPDEEDYKQQELIH